MFLLLLRRPLLLAHRLDGTEICHPAIYQYEGSETMLEQFAKRTPAAAIGSSDFHERGRLGLCWTFVFARDTSARAIVDAIRAKRTVVHRRNGQAFGDPELMTLAAADGRLPRTARHDSSPSSLDRVSQLLGLAALAGLILVNRR